MDFNKLKTFVIVAETGSVTLAAHELRRTQSAVSQQIALLEEGLGLNLLERVRSKIYLSRDGERIFALAKQKLGSLEDEIVSLKAETQSVQGHIRLGVLNDYGTDFHVGKAIGRFCQAHPDVTFSVVEGTSLTLEAAAIDNVLDLAFIVVFQQPELFIRKAVYKNWHSLYTSASYQSKKGPFASYRSILEVDLVDLDEQFMGIGTFIAKNSPSLYSTLKHRRPNVVAPNLDIAKEIITSGYGIGMLPDFLVEREYKDGQIVKLFKSAKPLFGIQDLAYRTNHNLRLCEKLFIDFVVSNASTFRLSV